MYIRITIHKNVSPIIFLVVNYLSRIFFSVARGKKGILKPYKNRKAGKLRLRCSQPLLFPLFFFSMYAAKLRETESESRP